MHRIVRFALPTVLLLSGFLAVGAAHGGAQQATPTVDLGLVSSFESLGHGEPAAAPGYVLGLTRITWMPGWAVGTHTHSSSDVFFVLSGTLGWTIQQGATTIQRGTVDGTPGPKEEMQIGVEAILNPGDALFVDFAAGTYHSARVIGDAPVVIYDAEFGPPE